MDAATTTVTTTAGPETPVTTSGDTATVTLAAVTTATIANGYDVGSLELSKELDGLGAPAWGTNRFTVDVSCSLTDSSGTRAVWLDAYDFQVVGGDMSPARVLIESLVIGAECTLTETQTAGATFAFVTNPLFTLGSSNLVTLVDLENDFEITELRLTQQFTLDTGISTMTLSNIFVLAMTGIETLPWTIGALLLLLLLLLLGGGGVLIICRGCVADRRLTSIPVSGRRSSAHRPGCRRPRCCPAARAGRPRPGRRRRRGCRRS